MLTLAEIETLLFQLRNTMFYRQSTRFHICEHCQEIYSLEETCECQNKE